MSTASNAVLIIQGNVEYCGQINKTLQSYTAAMERKPIAVFAGIIFVYLHAFCQFMPYVNNKFDGLLTYSSLFFALLNKITIVSKLNYSILSA